MKMITTKLNSKAKKPDVPDSYYDKKLNDYNLEDRQIDLDMRTFILDTAKIISKDMITLEEKKTEWRDKILCWLLSFFIIGMVLLIIIAGLEAFDKLYVSNTVILSILGGIITQVIAIFILFVKFINDNKHLEMYKTLAESLINSRNNKD